LTLNIFFCQLISGQVTLADPALPVHDLLGDFIFGAEPVQMPGGLADEVGRFLAGHQLVHLVQVSGHAAPEVFQLVLECLKAAIDFVNGV